MVKVLKPKAGGKKAPVRSAKKESPKEDVPFDFREESLNMLSKFLLGPTDLEMKVRQMEHAQEREVPEWMAALELMRDHIIKTEDPELKLRMYQAMVELLAKFGHQEDMRAIQEIIARVNLKTFKEMGFERVEVECAEDCCPNCRQLNGKRFLIDDAMTTMPIPCPDCTTEMYAVHSYCRCRYFAVF
jgi:hypothetical protein